MRYSCATISIQAYGKCHPQPVPYKYERVIRSKRILRNIFLVILSFNNNYTKRKLKIEEKCESEFYLKISNNFSHFNLKMMHFTGFLWKSKVNAYGLYHFISI